MLAALACAPGLADAPPQRIASLNKCADQLLVSLVDRARIASVSPIAADAFSFLADQLKDLPTNSGRGESILLSNADLILAGPFESPMRREFLARQGFEIVTVDVWTRIDDGKAQIRALSRRLAAEAAGERLIGIANVYERGKQENRREPHCQENGSLAPLSIPPGCTYKRDSPHPRQHSEPVPDDRLSRHRPSRVSRSPEQDRSPLKLISRVCPQQPEPAIQAANGNRARDYPRHHSGNRPAPRDKQRSNRTACPPPNPKRQRDK